MSQAHYEAVDALPELPNESDESASSEDKDPRCTRLVESGKRSHVLKIHSQSKDPLLCTPVYFCKIDREAQGSVRAP